MMRLDPLVMFVIETVKGFDCDAGVSYPTNMDGSHKWKCTRYPCGSADIVACSGHYGHQYPFDNFEDGTVATRILWGFMKNYNASMANLQRKFSIMKCYLT